MGGSNRDLRWTRRKRPVRVPDFNCAAPVSPTVGERFQSDLPKCHDTLDSGHLWVVWGYSLSVSDARDSGAALERVQLETQPRSGSSLFAAGPILSSYRYPTARSGNPRPPKPMGILASLLVVVCVSGVCIAS